MAAIQLYPHALHPPCFPLFPVGFDDTVQVFFNHKPLHRMAARHNGTLKRKNVIKASEAKLIRPSEEIDEPLGHQCSRTCGRWPGVWGTGRQACVPAGWTGAGCAAAPHRERCRKRCTDEGCGAPASGLSSASGSGPTDNPDTDKNRRRGYSNSMQGSREQKWGRETT